MQIMADEMARSGSHFPSNLPQSQSCVTCGTFIISPVFHMHLLHSCIFMYFAGWPLCESGCGSSVSRN